MSGEGKVVCVTGASGYVASWLVKLLLDRRYTVHATVRSLDDPKKTEHLLALDGAKERLLLFEADLTVEGSFDSAVNGCVCVFHTASPVVFSVDDPQVELLDPALKGTINVLKSAVKVRSLKRVVLTSSIATVMFGVKLPESGGVVDETWFSDPVVCEQKKWWYLLSKIQAEDAAVKFSKENDLDLVVINPGYVIGPLLQPTLNVTSQVFMSFIETGKEILEDGIYMLVDVRDTAIAHILAFEKPEANGRYCIVGDLIRSSKIIKILDKLRPDLDYSLRYKDSNCDEVIPYSISKARAQSLGVEFTPLEVGGLGIPKLSMVNLALLAKWAWRFVTEDGSLWRRTIEAIHGGRGLWTCLPIKRTLSGCWKSIVNILDAVRIQGKPLHLFIRGLVGNGARIRFWYDIWVGDRALKDRWPCIYRLEKIKGCRVRDRLLQNGSSSVLSGEWRRQPSTVEELSELEDMRRLFMEVSFAEGMDKWKWNADSNGPFSVKDFKHLVSNMDARPRLVSIIKWEAWVPLKVNLLSWRAAKERLPTRVALRNRNINIPNLVCPLCDWADEDGNHLMVRCSFSYGVWTMICKWCRLDPFFAYDFDDLMHLYNNIHAGKWRKKIVRGIVMITAWSIWNTRNMKIFQDKERKIMEVVAEVKSKAFLWLKYRSKYKDIVWKEWSIYPLYTCL